MREDTLFIGRGALVDTNPKMTKDTTRKIQKGQSSQNTKLRLT